MKQQTKLTQKQEQHAEHQTHAHATKEFPSSDELLRFDAEHTILPPEVAKRLQESVAHIPPPPPRTWWRNLFAR